MLGQDNGTRRRIFGKAEKPAPAPAAPAAEKGDKQPASGATLLRHPRSFTDVEEIIDRLRERRTVIVYLSEVNTATAQRVTDMLSGAVYALGGTAAKLQKDMYIFTPDGVEAN